MIAIAVLLVFIVKGCATPSALDSHLESPPGQNLLTEDSQLQVPQRSIAAEELYVAKRLTDKKLFSAGIDGPAVDKAGNLYVANFLKKGTIGKMIIGFPFETWHTISAVNVSEDSARPPRQGALSSLRFDAQNRMYIADYVNHRVLRMDPETKEVQTYFLASESGVEMNQPNDIAIARDGTLYLSDPGWNKNDEKRGAIWRINPGGKAKQIISGLFNPNGIELSPDDKKLYFTESATAHWTGPPNAKEFIYVVDLKSKGPPKLFAEYPGLNLDGMRADSKGNIFVAIITGGAIDQLSPTGQFIRRIKLTAREPTNIGFGGPDGRTAYVTQRDGGYVEFFRVEHPGRDWLILQKR